MTALLNTVARARFSGSLANGLFIFRVGKLCSLRHADHSLWAVCTMRSEITAFDFWLHPCMPRRVVIDSQIIIIPYASDVQDFCPHPRHLPPPRRLPSRTSAPDLTLTVNPNPDWGEQMCAVEVFGGRRHRHLSGRIWITICGGVFLNRISFAFIST